MNQSNILEKGNMGQKVQNRPLLSDCLKQEELALPSQIKVKRNHQEKLMADILLQKKHLLRDQRLQ
ncbi:MAG: hypothetical protein H7336_07795 [Bacteriovorax sp.]|nr:hypothetical protein [Bacteriovorax sp.]